MNDYLIKKRIKELCADNEHLTNEQNILLFKEMEQEKLKNIPLEDIDARTLLILGNKKIIYYVLGRQFGIYGNYDEMEEFSAGQIGLIKAIDTYNMESGVRFMTYAYRVIVNEIRMYYRQLNGQGATSKQIKTFLDDVVMQGKDDSVIRIKDLLYGDDDFVQLVEDEDTMHRIIKNLRYLNYMEAFSVIHYYGLFNLKPLNQEEIGKVFGLSRCTISKTINSGIHKLKILTLNADELRVGDKVLRNKILQSGVQLDQNQLRGIVSSRYEIKVK